MQVKDERVDTMNRVGSCYPTFTVFNVLCNRDIVVFWSFSWAYIYDPRSMMLLITSQFYFVFARVEVTQKLYF
jgi:hypothetical protein